ncbi:MAG TPA: 3-oxoacyl-[acyl-carrier-protein] synthase III C-terminal domain-containing protein [Pyrinomonadaceae bacterium]|jgi:3-oxoacyl-[acyl-carrier-protein] synthase III|nr:3-oxoacyl-[acyl-carrier-protein] synthase III C-terminal domain-containing protein [Pyrinomonadaceae bacterium]
MRFLAIEHVLPSEVVTNEFRLNEVVNKSKDYFSAADLNTLRERLVKVLKLAKTEIRYVRSPDEKAFGLGVKAGMRALQTAGLDPTDIDLMIYVGVGRGFLEPATANVFQDALGLTKATCFDVLDACASWLRAVDVAHSFLKTKIYKRIMILNCECNREYGDLIFRSFEDIDFKFPGLTIGEAATATILTDSDEDDLYYSTFKTWGDKHTLCKIPLPHYREFSNGNDIDNLPALRFYSYGEQLFRVVFKKLVEHYRGDEQINAFKHDIAFGHSASDSMSEKIGQILKLDNTYLSHSRFGNTVSASIPLGMSHAIDEESLKPNMNVLLGCGSAGITTAWTRFRYLD